MHKDTIPDLMQLTGASYFPVFITNDGAGSRRKGYSAYISDINPNIELIYPRSLGLLPG